MGKKQDVEPRPSEPRSFTDRRTIDVGDDEAMRFWSERLGVPEEEIVEAVKAVGPNATAVLLKLDAPQTDTTAPPISSRS
jgi:hypothetical protein